MNKGVVFQSIFNGLVLIIVAISSIAIAGLLGPSDFGKYATLQAISAMLIPLVTLRLETRIAICPSTKQLARLLSSAATSTVIFVFIGLLFTPVAAQFFDWRLVVAVIVLAASSAMLETLINCYSYQGKLWEIIKYRGVRQSFPALVALLCAFLFNDVVITVFALVVSTFVCLLILLSPMRHMLSLSMGVWRDILSEHSSGLRASLALGGLNAIWLNGLLPLMNVMGLSYLAGQYALAQRLMNAPLGVVALSVRSVLLRGGNGLHKEGRDIAIKAALLFFIAILLTGILYWAIYIQTLILFPEEWKLDKLLFIAAVFFMACSFAVGSVSVLGIRLQDEWFLACWQLVFLVIWAVILIYLPSDLAFVYMLAIGGVGYWILLIRWVTLSRNQHG
jgi:O-antigen/teichoic acid export membrane protein